jgi:hypothetical protein
VGVTLTPPPSFLQQVSGKIFKDDVNGFSSTSDICFVIVCELKISEAICVVPISEDTAGWYEAVNGVADCSHQDPELVPSVDIFLCIILVVPRIVIRIEG